jgi:hypothetical protein
MDEQSKCAAPGLEGQPNCKEMGWLDEPFSPNCYCQHNQAGPFKNAVRIEDET